MLTIDDKIKLHQSCIENLEDRKELNSLLDRYRIRLELKKANTRESEVIFYTVSELENEINKVKDMIYESEKIYKEMVQILVN